MLLKKIKIMEIACRATKKLLTFSLMKNKNNRELEIEPSMESSNIAHTHTHTLRKLFSAFFADLFCVASGQWKCDP